MLKGVLERVNWQVMDDSFKTGKDGAYVPNYELLIMSASCEDEENYLRSAEAAGIEFAFNMVYVTKMACGHYEMFQTPQSEFNPLSGILIKASEQAQTNKCTRCICGW